MPQDEDVSRRRLREIRTRLLSAKTAADLQFVKTEVDALLVTASGVAPVAELKELVDRAIHRELKKEDFLKLVPTDDPDEVSPAFLGGTRPYDDVFSISFDDLTPDQVEASLGALADYYRACGGIGLEVEPDSIAVVQTEPRLI